MWTTTNYIAVIKDSRYWWRHSTGKLKGELVEFCRLQDENFAEKWNKAGVLYPSMCAHDAGEDGRYNIPTRWWKHIADANARIIGGIKSYISFLTQSIIGLYWVNADNLTNSTRALGWEYEKPIPIDVTDDTQIKVVDASCCKNRVHVIAVDYTAKKAKIEAIPMDTEPYGDFFNNTLLWNKGTSEGLKKNIFGIVVGVVYGLIGGKQNIDCYHPRLTDNGVPYVIIDLDRLEQFAELPINITVGDIGCKIRAVPNVNAPVIRSVSKGTLLTVLEYKVYGVDTWGRVGVDEWILLQWTTRGGTTEFTSWTTQTKPPLSETDKYKEYPPIEIVNQGDNMSLAHGIDLSKYQTSFTYPSNPPKPVDFAIQRASYGLVKDEKFNEIALGMIDTPVRGCYHYFSTAAGAIDQANFYLDVMADAPYKPHFYVADYEELYNKLNATSYSELIKFIHHVQDKTGLPCLLYTSPNIYQYYMDVFGEEHKEFGLWIAQYYYNPNPETQLPKLNGSYTKDWVFWQYGITTKYGNTEVGTMYGSGNKALDVNVFNGTVAEMQAMFNTTIPSTLPDIPESNCKTDELISDIELVLDKYRS
jgi:GH25 family lysozyme M1 (1,4-beta-N-acetylmuramidase)